MTIPARQKTVRRHASSWLHRVLTRRLAVASLRTLAGARSGNAEARVKRYLASLALLLATGPVLAGCSDTSEPQQPQPQPVVPVATVAVSPDTMALLVGESRQATATPRDAQGRALTRAVTWRSSAPAIASVDNSGNVRALGAGRATITAVADGVEGGAIVDVMQVVPELGLSKDTLYFVGMAGIHSPVPQAVQVTAARGQVGGLVVDITYAPGLAADWLVATLAAVAAPTALDVTATTGSLFPGIYRATVGIRSITDTAVVGRRVEVVFEVQPGPQLDISATDRHNCAVDLAGRAWCWGYNGSKQLGVGSERPHESRSMLLPGDARYLAVSTGELFGCGITIEREAFCWGTGYMGDGGSGVGFAPTRVAGGHRWAHVAAGYRHACGITVDGDTYCWGVNDGGQVGNDTRVAQPQPVRIAGSARLVSLTAGEAHTCGVTASGEGYCWGRTAYGRLGSLNNSTDSERTPVRVGGDLQWARLSAGQLHTCGITRDGRAYCWGYNGSGQLGDDSRTTRTAPTPVSTAARFSAIAAGRNHTCAVAIDGQAWCWGYRTHGGIGDGSDMGYALAPTQVLGGVAFKRVTAGNNHSCGVSTADQTYCWGYNALGAIGDGTTTDRLQPVRIELR